MRPTILTYLLAVMVISTMTASGASDEQPVATTLDSTLPTASKQIRQFAFDGDPQTYYASAGKPGEMITSRWPSIARTSWNRS